MQLLLLWLLGIPQSVGVMKQEIAGAEIKDKRRSPEKGDRIQETGGRVFGRRAKRDKWLAFS